MPRPRSSETQDADILYLFSSNIRPLYAQDILNVLAAPSGMSYTFRYEKGYVPDELASIWGAGLLGRKAIIHFSLQHASRYHEPVFFPIRIAYVQQAQRLGDDIFLLEFVLDRIISLGTPGQEGDEHRFSRPAHEYTEYLRSYLGGSNLPYRVSISSSQDLTEEEDAPIDVTADEIVLFDRNTKYLWRTDAFREAWFVHVLGISERGLDSVSEVRTSRLKTDEHLFSLTGAETYNVHIVQRQPREVSGEASFLVEADEEIVRVVGRKGFTVASRYDRILVPVHAVEPPDGSPRRTVLTIEPDGLQGPRVIVPLKVTPSPEQAQTAVGTGLALLILGLLSFRPDSPAWEKGLFVAAAVGAHLFTRLRTLVTAWRERSP